MGTIMKTDSDNYSDIADAIRTKSSSSSTFLPSEMGDAIRAIPSGGGVPADVIADEYDNTSTYSEGNYVIYEDELYKCNTDISVAEEWDSTHWTLTNVTDEIDGKSFALAELTDISITSATDGQVLTYDNNSGEWINSNLSIPSDADDISYNNTTSGMTATNVQDAIDELNTTLGDIETLLAAI